MKIFGYIVLEKDVPKSTEAPESQKVLDLKAQVHLLSKERDSLKEGKEAAERKLQTPFIDTDLGDTAPLDTEQRKIYVATVAGLHKDILEPKMKFMISRAHELSEGLGNTRDTDLILKGVVHAFREIIKWGNQMVNEQVSNQNKN